MMTLHGKSTAVGGSSSVGSSSSSGDGTGGFNWSMKDYYHGEIRKEFCEDLLKEDGDFLIRLSKNQEFVISVLCCGKVRHFQPDYDGTTYSLGDKEYAKIDDLIFYHWSQHVPIGGEANTKLKKPVARTKTTFAESEIEVISKLGSGNFGDVFKVRIKSDGRFVAMKTLRENVSRDTKDAFVKEMEMMAAMCHDNVVRCIGTVKSEGEMKILLELVNQGSLDKLLPKRLFTERGKSRLMLDIARGIEYLHRHNIMHRDLAARNVLVNRNKDHTITAKVSDFGLSRKDDSGRGYTLKTSQKLPLKWLAPECFTKRMWTLASDVWSYGIVVWEVLSDGKEPYADMTFPNAQALSVFVAGGGHPTLLANAGAEWPKIMEMCWTKDPFKRPKMDAILAEVIRVHDAGRSQQSQASAVISSSAAT